MRSNLTLNEKIKTRIITGRGEKYFLYFLLPALIVIILFFVIFLLPNATITIIPKTEPVVTDLKIKVDSSAKEILSYLDLIPGKVMEEDKVLGAGDNPDELKKELAQKIKNKLSSDEILLDNLVDATTAPIGGNKNEIRIKALIFNLSDLKHLAGLKIGAITDPGKEIAKNTIFDYTSSDFNPIKMSAAVALHIEDVATPKLNLDDIRNEAVGKSEIDFKNWLLLNPEIKAVEINNFSIFSKKLPIIPKRIKINIDI